MVVVQGVRVHGDKVTDVDVKLDDLFGAVPVPAKLGVPIVWKKQSGTGGDDSHIRSNAIVRFMADPDDGMAPEEWQYGGRRGPAPPVVLVRRDRIPFSSQDWALLNDFISEWLETRCEYDDSDVDMADEDLPPRRYLTPDSFRDYVYANKEQHPSAFLSVHYPLASIVMANGLSVAELNGKEGEVKQYSRDRVGVQFEGKETATALKPERLTLVRLAPAPCKKPPEAIDPEQVKKRREGRATELVRRDAEQIARRFIECLHQDTFPEWGDLHYFGVGSDYHSRAQEVLAVWQGAVKHGDMSEEDLVEALAGGTMEQLFMKTCESLAKSKTPNSTYANMLIENRFAALEWDTL